MIRELLKLLCPEPQRKTHFYNKLSNLLYDQLLCDYTQKFVMLQEFVEKNKKFPAFKEDFERIRRDPELYSLYKKISILEKSSHYRNKIVIEKFRKPEFQKLGIPNINILFEFLDAALKYQQENLCWFTMAEWFNKNSTRIFENLAVFDINQNYQKIENNQFFEENDFIESWIMENQNPKKSKGGEFYTQPCRNHWEHQTYTMGKKNENYSNKDTFDNQESENDREQEIKTNKGKFNHYIRQHKSLR